MNSSPSESPSSRPPLSRFQLTPLAGKRILGYFAICCPMRRPADGGIAKTVSRLEDLPPDTTDVQVWVTGWDCQFTRPGSTNGVERKIAHAGVHSHAFFQDGQWFVQASMTLSDVSDATHWSGWIDLMGIAIG